MLRALRMELNVSREGLLRVRGRFGGIARVIRVVMGDDGGTEG